ncbi:MAG: RDD family protein, partial [Gaiellaceae bacterium]
MDATYEAGSTSILHARAGFWRRFASAFIDGLVVGVVRFVLVYVVGGGLAWLLSAAVAAAYFTWFHGSSGQTPGDAAVSIRVVDADGGRPIGYGRAFIRWLVSLVSGFVLLIGYLWMLWDGEKQTWHDKAARSYVVPTS